MYEFEVYSTFYKKIIAYVIGDNEKQAREKFPEFYDEKLFWLMRPIYVNCN